MGIGDESYERLLTKTWRVSALIRETLGKVRRSLPTAGAWKNRAYRSTVCLCADMRRDREKTTRQYANNLHPHPAADYRNPKNIVSSVQSFVLARPSSHLQFTSYSFSNIYKIPMFEFGTKYGRNNARLSLQWNRLIIGIGLNDCFYLFSSFMCSSCRY